MTQPRKLARLQAWDWRFLSFVLLHLLVFWCCCAESAESPARREWTVDGITREALVYVPSAAKQQPTPVIFVFHGHGGNMNGAARNFHYHRLWPEAIVVYMQGLNTPGRLTDPAGRLPGWQAGLGQQGDRDLKFFDAVLASLEHDYRVDEKRIYAAGHSNGGAFTYLLWATHSDRFAAFAPSGAAFPVSLSTNETVLARGRISTPKPVFHVAGENDPLVKFSWQKQTLDALRQLNQCGEGEPAGQFCTLYPSKIGAPLMTFIHPGGHQFPEEALEPIVKFFKEHARP
jgi:polyhydroxybutyrate depolymerase